MAKFCKWLLIFMVVTTLLPCILAVVSLAGVVAAVLFGSAGGFGLGVLVALALVTVPGTLIALIGSVLGWIGGFLGKIALSVISVVLVAAGLAVWFLAFVPWCSVIVFVIALVFGLACIKKQKKHNEYEENI